MRRCSLFPAFETKQCHSELRDRANNAQQQSNALKLQLLQTEVSQHNLLQLMHLQQKLQESEDVSSEIARSERDCQLEIQGLKTLLQVQMSSIPVAQGA